MTDDLRAVATELLRLYDWRFELAKEEETLQNTPIDAIDVRDVAMREASDFEAAPLIQRRATLDKKLRQYGREKKAAWERLRALLARPVDEPQCDGYAGDVGASAPRCESYRGHAGRHFIDHRAIVPSASSPATMCVCGHDHAHAIKYDDPDCPVVLCDCQNFRPTSSPTNERVERYEEALQEILTISADDFPAYARIDSEARNGFMDGRESAAKIAREALRIRAEELGRSQKEKV